MCEKTTKVNRPHCKGSEVKKNGKKRTGKQNMLCNKCKKQFQCEYFYRGGDPATKGPVCSMSLNGSGIRDIQRVLGLSIVCILFVLRGWVKQHKEPQCKGSYKQVQVDGFRTFVKHRKAGKRCAWYAYDKETKQVLAFQIGKRNDKSCKALLEKLSHLTIETFCTDDWKPYKKYIPKEKHVISKSKTTYIERCNRDFRTHIKRLARVRVCF